MSARVLITGASGGIGSAAMRELRARGAQVGRFAENGLAGELAARLAPR